MVPEKLFDAMRNTQSNPIRFLLENGEIFVVADKTAFNQGVGTFGVVDIETAVPFSFHIPPETAVDGGLQIGGA